MLRSYLSNTDKSKANVFWCPDDYNIKVNRNPKNTMFDNNRISYGYNVYNLAKCKDTMIKKPSQTVNIIEAFTDSSTTGGGYYYVCHWTQAPGAYPRHQKGYYANTLWTDAHVTKVRSTNGTWKGLYSDSPSALGNRWGSTKYNKWDRY